MLLVAPIYAFYLVVHYADLTVEADDGMIILAEGLRYVVDWLLYPVIFYEIARRRGWLERYPRYIAALNWINLPAVVLLLFGESVAEIAPPTAAALLQIGLQILFFYWFMMATRLALGVNWLFATVLMIVNWVPSYFLSLIVNRFLGVSFPA
jgi:hypothetical protein